MSQSEPKARLQAALKKLPPRPYFVDILPPSKFQRQGFTMIPGDQSESMVIPQDGIEVGALRWGHGSNVVEPWPESNSLLVSVPGVIGALAEVVNAAQALIDEESATKEAAAAESA
jgi:hypothetical protein